MPPRPSAPVSSPLSVAPTSAEVSIGDPLLIVANPHDKFGNRIEDLTLLFSIPTGLSDSIIYQTGMLVAGEQLGEVDVVVTALQGDTSKTVLSKVVVQDRSTGSSSFPRR